MDIIKIILTTENTTITHSSIHGHYTRHELYNWLRSVSNRHASVAAAFDTGEMCPDLIRLAGIVTPSDSDEKIINTIGDKLPCKHVCEVNFQNKMFIVTYNIWGKVVTLPLSFDECVDKTSEEFSDLCGSLLGL